MRDIDEVEIQYIFPKVRESKTKHRFMLRWERFKGVQRGNYFTKRMVSAWNELPEARPEEGTFL